MLYLSTRNNKIEKKPSEAVLEGIAKDGGLYMPRSFEGVEFPMDKLSEIHMEPQQMETIYELLESNGIEVVENLERELDEIEANDFKLSIALYVRGGAGTDDVSIEDATSEWMNSSAKMHAEYLALNALIKAGDDDETL